MLRTMPGFNHFSDCACGWCHTYRPQARASPLAIARLPSTESSIDANARCPVCAARVYFYISPNGGRVYFDALGPPWPKHPCTATAPERSIERSVRPQMPASQPGWRPLRHVPPSKQRRKIERRLAEGWINWSVRDAERGSLFTLLTEEQQDLPEHFGLYLTPWDSSGRASVSYLWVTGNDVVPRYVRVWNPVRYGDLPLDVVQRFQDLASPERMIAAISSFIETLPDSSRTLTWWSGSGRVVAPERVLSAVRIGIERSFEPDWRSNPAARESMITSIRDEVRRLGFIPQPSWLERLEIYVRTFG